MATARAAKAKKTMQMLSTVTSFAVEEVAKALGTPPWYQLYMPTAWADTEKVVKRVEAAGCPVLAWTIDHPECDVDLPVVADRGLVVDHEVVPIVIGTRGCVQVPAFVRIGH